MQGRKRIVAVWGGILIAVLLVITVGVVLHFHHKADALWKIISQQCVVGEQQRHNPSPCLQVNEAAGYALLKDRHGPLQFLLLPIAKIPGIESPELLDPGTPDFFAEAWLSRRVMADRYGKKIDDRVYSLAVNSRWGRTQNQLHIHISCLRPDIRQQLDAIANGLNETWQVRRLGDTHYFLRAITEADFYQISPFIRVANELPGAADNMGNYGIAVASLGEGKNVLMAVEGGWLSFNRGTAEALQDHRCALLSSSD